ncbi:MAG: hypothetical protein Fur0023_13610 [Bacteroidia bacterium]
MKSAIKYKNRILNGEIGSKNKAIKLTHGKLAPLKYPAITANNMPKNDIHIVFILNLNNSGFWVLDILILLIKVTKKIMPQKSP